MQELTLRINNGDVSTRPEDVATSGSSPFPGLPKQLENTSIAGEVFREGYLLMQPPEDGQNNASLYLKTEDDEQRCMYKGCRR